MPDDLSDAERDLILHNGRFIGFFNSLTYAFAIASAKLAILFLYWRIFQLSSIRLPMQIMITMCFIWIIVRTFMTIFRCLPVQAYWDKTIPHAVCRIRDTEFFFSTVLTHFLMDLAILVLPIIEVFKLRLRIGQKIAVAALFIVGSMYVTPGLCYYSVASNSVIVFVSRRYSLLSRPSVITPSQHKCPMTMVCTASGDPSRSTLPLYLVRALNLKPVFSLLTNCF